MTLLGIYNDLQPGSNYMKRLEGAVIERVAIIRAEALNTPLHTERLLWARNVEQNLTEAVRRMKIAISTQIANNAGPPAELDLATDAQIRIAMGQVVNNFLGDQQ